ncbi:2-C-methyl-D-erythritol 2,4-cyclodiphosphate synthase [Sutterella sp.]|uniref:2-C-methyl-D-erythritol 2,4-cyclodiphosphate synthase n=1 Tax=Sutterella sp. TaxID=1981025 RepID=UPI003FD72C1B
MSETSETHIYALIPAAGVGRRMGADRPKQYMTVAGEPMLAQTVRALERVSRIERIFVVVSAADAWIDEVAKTFSPRVKVLRAGGAERADSVLGGLTAAQLPGDAWVLVHDAARPCVRPSEVNHLIDEVLGDAHGDLAGGILAVPMADTVKRADPQRMILETVPRADLWRAATPQLFRVGTLLRALTAGLAGVTDEASAVERLGLPVKVVSCRSANLKVTEPGDEKLAELILGEKNMQAPQIPQIRVGQGYDSHRLVEGRRLILGGVEIPFEKGLDGHSDADVLLHALTDAVLGAAALGDIGQHFPPSDPQWKGADSRKLLRAVVELARRAGWTIVNVDATLVAERPKIGPHMKAIRESVAQTLGVAVEQVSVKAKTNERMDAVGHEEGMMAQAVALLVRTPEASRG